MKIEIYQSHEAITEIIQGCEVISLALKQTVATRFCSKELGEL